MEDGRSTPPGGSTAWRPGLRPLLARSCIRCGRFLPGSEYQVVGRSRRPWCRSCDNARKRAASPPKTAPHVGARPLVAKSCNACHRLRSDFYRRKDGLWTDICKACYAAKARTFAQKINGRGNRVNSPDVQRRAHLREHLENARSRSQADRSHYPWTGSELEVLVTRPDLRAKDLAQILGRTIAAVRRMRQKAKQDPKYRAVAGAAHSAPLHRGSSS